MAKKKKKKKGGGAKFPTSPREIQAQAQTHLEAGRYRQALDAFKQLAKAAPDAPADGMQAARKGLYRQMLDKGMLEEAAMVLEAMEDGGGSEGSAEVVRLHFQKKDFSKAAEAAARALAEGVSLSPKALGNAADALVLSFEEAPDLPEPVARERNAVLDALRRVAEKDYDGALAAVKPVGLRSIFGSWKWWIKGVCAFYQKEDEKARKAFEAIPADSVPGRAAGPFRKLMEDSAESEEKASPPAFLEAEFTVAGCGEAAAPLARAQYLCRVNRHRDSHAHLMETLQRFPTMSNGLTRSLAEFYYNRPLFQPPQIAVKYMDALITACFNRPEPAVAESFWTRRMAAIGAERFGRPDEEVLERWENVIDSYEAERGDAPLVKALVYERMGNFFAREIEDDSPFGHFFSRRRKAPELWNQELAEECFEMAAEALPRIESELNRIAFYEKTGDDSAANRLLDEVIRDFPPHKEVLHKAGARCMSRNALIKGMKYLEQALSMDPMDKRLRKDYLLVCSRAAIRYIQNGQTEKARALFPRMIEAADPHAHHWVLGLDTVQVRISIFERLLGNDESAESFWRKANAHPFSDPFILRLFYWMMGSYYGLRENQLKETKAHIWKAMEDAPKIAHAREIVTALDFAGNLPEAPSGLSEFQDRFHDYLFRLAEGELNASDADHLLYYVYSPACRSKELAEALIEAGLRKNPDNAFFGYHRFLFHNFPRIYEEGPEPSDYEAMESLLKKARAQNHLETARQIQNHLEEWKREEALNYEDQDDDDDEDIPDFPFPIPEEWQELRDEIENLKNLDVEDLEEAINNLKKRFLSSSGKGKKSRK
ncbi:MAG: tetratricopeptide repeat protein [Thermodesulfobacteriota bacterium]